MSEWLKDATEALSEYDTNPMRTAYGKADQLRKCMGALLAHLRTADTARPPEEDIEYGILKNHKNHKVSIDECPDGEIDLVCNDCQSVIVARFVPGHEPDTVPMPKVTVVMSQDRIDARECLFDAGGAESVIEPRPAEWYWRRAAKLWRGKSEVPSPSREFVSGLIDSGHEMLDALTATGLSTMPGDTMSDVKEAAETLRLALVAQPGEEFKKVVKITHILRSGHPLCGFMAESVPGDWPEGHTWADVGSSSEVDPGVRCERCFESLFGG